MAFIPAPEKKYRLYDGTRGTEWEMWSEVLKRRQAEFRKLEEEIEILQLKLQTAEGRPV